MKKFIAFMLAVCLLLSLGGCGKGADVSGTAEPAQSSAPDDAAQAVGTKTEAGLELKLAAETAALPEGMAYASAQCRVSDMVWLGGTADSGAVLGSVSLDGGSSGLVELPAGCDFVYAMCPVEGGIAALAGSRPARFTNAQGLTVDTENPDGRLWLLRYGETRPVSQAELSETYFFNTGTPAVFKSMLELNGDFYIQCQNMIVRLDAEGNELSRFEFDTSENRYISSMLVYGGELMAAKVGFFDQDTQLLRLDTESLELIGETQFGDMKITGLGIAEDGALLACTGSGVLKLGEGLMLGDYVCLWSELFISGGFTRVEELEDGYLFYKPYQEKLYTVRWREALPRKTIVVAADDQFSGVSALTNAFNLSQLEYEIELKFYDTYDEAQQKLLQAEIGAGQWPDVFAFSLPETLSEMRPDAALVDLYDYFDDELSADDFVPSLLSAMEARGALYWLPYSFQMITLTGPAALVPRAALSYGELEAIAEKYAMSVIDPYISRGQFLTWCCPMALERFVDWESGTCCFDSGGFVEFLELCGKLPADDDGTRFFLPHDNYLLFYEDLQSFSRLSVLPEVFGDFRFAGFPDSPGNGSMFSVQLKLGITAGAQEMEGAWEFLKFASSEEGQSVLTETGFPANAEALERGLRAIISDGSAGAMGSGYPFSRADAQKFRELVAGAEMVVGADPTLEKIITDGAAAFFAGDKSAEEAARGIQARASLYVAERG